MSDSLIKEVTPIHC